MKTPIRIFLIFFVGWIAISFMDSIEEKITNTITIHEVMCVDRNSSVFDCKMKGSHLLASARTFRVNFDKQLVIEKGQAFGANNWGKCAVFNLSNWGCEIKDSDFISMSDGNISEYHTNFPTAPLNIVQVGKLKYWYVKLQNMRLIK